MVRYDDYSSGFKLLYPKLTSMSVMNLTCTSLSRMSLTVNPMCTGLNDALCSPVEYRHSFTLPLSLGINRKLLNNSDVSPIPNRTIICCFCM